MSTISLPGKAKESINWLQLVFILKPVVGPSKMMGCRQLWTGCAADQCHRRGFRKQNCNENQMNVKIIPDNSYSVMQWDPQDKEDWPLGK